MVIRDLTLRSAASFGSFHLIRLLYDEYMFFIVEHKVAEATQTTPIAVMGKTERMVIFCIYLYLPTHYTIKIYGLLFTNPSFYYFAFTEKSYTRY